MRTASDEQAWIQLQGDSDAQHEEPGLTLASCQNWCYFHSTVAFKHELGALGTLHVGNLSFGGAATTLAAAGGCTALLNSIFDAVN